mgnify:CR=1 FL=1
MTQDTPQITQPISVKSNFSTLHVTCSKALEDSFEGEYGARMSLSYLFVTDLENWVNILSLRPENALFKLAEQEYMSSLLNVAQGQYRNAFKGLRLVLELIIQGTYLSANIIELQEWLRNARDTNWTTLTGGKLENDVGEEFVQERGPMCKRFSDAFFPEIRDQASTFNTMARTLYRELSETIHGNMPNHIPLPSSLEFDKETFELWHEKAETTRLLCIFCLTLRYAAELTETERASIEAGVSDQLGHIEPIRILFGGPATS